MTLDNGIAELLTYAERYLGLDKRDELYARNRILSALGISSYGEGKAEGELPALPDGILQNIFDCLEREGVEFDPAVLGERLMDAVMLRPSEVENAFWVHCEHSPRAGTEWLYSYAIRSDYVKKSAIDKNLKWLSKDGRLEITINLSKPEKNNKDLAKQLKTVSTDYPKCIICRDNEGFERAGFSRRNMRTVSLRLNGEEWFWQYSPYAYFNEHGIAISCAHTPMKLDGNTAEHLFDFVEKFPHYFLGNNAPLPRVGGSILMHNHYQGGGYVLPMQRAGIRIPLKSKRFPKVKAGVVDWYNTAIRLEGENRKEVAALAQDIFTAWETYENAALGILPRTDEVHNTASLIARKTKNGYLLDIILRNNRTSEEHPGGIFHAHAEYHHIKSESIGLIEAMGLFVLPARLKRQLGEIEGYLTGERKFREGALGEDMKIFVPAIGRLMRGGRLSPEQAKDALRDEVESACKNILGNTAVFKCDGAGTDALLGFLSACGFDE